MDSTWSLCEVHENSMGQGNVHQFCCTCDTGDFSYVDRFSAN